MASFDPDLPRFTQADVLSVCGGTEKTLQNWTSRGQISLAAQNPGRAQRRLYRFFDLVKVRTMLTLTSLGVSAAFASRFAEKIVLARAADIETEFIKPADEWDWIENQHSARICVRDNDVQIVVSTDAITAMRRDAARAFSPNPQAYIHVDIDAIVLEVHGKVLDLLMKEIQDEDAGEEVHQQHEYPEKFARQIKGMVKISGLSEAFAEDLIKRKITVHQAREIILREMPASSREDHD